jgi:hypothetical protein
MEVICKIWNVMKNRKKDWLLPIILLVVVFGGIVILTQGSTIIPVSYRLF